MEFLCYSKKPFRLCGAIQKPGLWARPLDITVRPKEIGFEFLNTFLPRILFAHESRNKRERP